MVVLRQPLVLLDLAEQLSSLFPSIPHSRGKANGPRVRVDQGPVPCA